MSISKQDTNGVRSAQDLERKYDFASILGLKKNVKILHENLTKIDNELNNFITATASQISRLDSQLDDKIETFFYFGVPTLNVLPASEWNEDDYDNHLGDLYFDTSTGHSYRFAVQGANYLWLEIIDSDVTTALQLASDAQDTADGKRRIFTSEPSPPYDVGDLYFNNREIYICNNSKSDGIYVSSDFIVATKYTDDTNLNAFVNTTYSQAMQSLTNQIDSKIATWYYSGQPTLNNLPASQWVTADEKLQHTGDIYYDRNTGYCYIFDYSSNVYSWVRVKDNDIVQAMSTASAAQDTADNKRQIFVTQPTTPYSCGDLWITSNEIYICQTERLSGNFNSNDWINNLKYTDNTYAQAIVDELGGQTTQVLHGTVTQYSDSWVKYTDLATGGSTTINGSNITTGNINTDNVSIGNGNVRINNLGVFLRNGAKVIGEYGMYGNLAFPSMKWQELGYSINEAYTQDYKVIDIAAYIPSNFRISSAYMILQIHPVNWGYGSTNQIGYSRNINLYYESISSDTQVTPINVALASEQYDYRFISNNTQKLNCTGNSNMLKTFISDDLSSFLNSGQGTLFQLRTSNAPNSFTDSFFQYEIGGISYNSDYSKARAERTGYGRAMLIVYGFTAYE